MIKRYSNYKQSNIDWCPEIPSGWKSVRLGALFEERREKVNDRDFQPLSVTRNGVVPQLDDVAKSNDSENRKGVHKGDFVINSRSDRKGSSGIAPRDGSVSLINIVLKPHDVDPRFCEYLLKSYNFIEEFYRFGKGIVADLWTTRFDEMKSMILPVPPVEEQIAITAFLDMKTEEVQNFIALKNRAIWLLRERFENIKENLLNGNDWSNLKKIKYVANILPGFAFKSESFSTDPVGNRLLRGINVNPHSFNWGEVVYYPFLKSVELSDFILRTGDIVIGMDRPWVNGGIRVATIDQQGEGSLLVQRVARVRAHSNTLLQEYLYNILHGNNFRRYFDPILTGISVPHISADQIMNFEFNLPDIKRQVEICDQIKSHKFEIENAINQIEKEIRLSRDYLTSLTSEAVTGKIDVRGVAVSNQTLSYSHHEV